MLDRIAPAINDIAMKCGDVYCDATEWAAGLVPTLTKILDLIVRVSA